MDDDIYKVHSLADALGTTWINDWSKVQQFQKDLKGLLEELQARRLAAGGAKAWQHPNETGLLWCHGCFKRFIRLVGESLCEECWNEKHPEQSGHFTISKGCPDEWVPDQR